jgi:membrane protease YdiL (CAAX protease family)
VSTPPGEVASATPSPSLLETKLELGMALLVLVLPSALARFASSTGSATLEDELFLLVYSAGETSLVLYLLWRGGRWTRVAGLQRPRIGVELGWALLLVLIWSFISIAFSMLAGPPDPPQSETTSAFWLPSSPAGWCVVSASTLLAAGFEELFFRAYLWHRLTRLTRSPLLALLLSSTLFALVHPYGLLDSVEMFVFAMTFGLFFWMDRSLWRLILAHTLYNLIITAEWVLSPFWI